MLSPATIRMLEQTARDPSREIGSGASEQDIAAAEQSLGIRVPPDLRQFFRAYGWLESPWLTVYGLGGDVPEQCELIRNVMWERTKAHPPVPDTLLPLVNDGSGNHYCYDAGAGNVVFWDHDLDEDQAPEVVAPSFDAYLLKELTELDGSLQ